MLPSNKGSDQEAQLESTKTKINFTFSQQHIYAGSNLYMFTVKVDRYMKYKQQYGLVVQRHSKRLLGGGGGDEHVLGHAQASRNYMEI